MGCGCGCTESTNNKKYKPIKKNRSPSNALISTSPYIGGHTIIYSDRRTSAYNSQNLLKEAWASSEWETGKVSGWWPADRL